MSIDLTIDGLLLAMADNGSRISDYVIPGLGADELREAEEKMGSSFPEDLKQFLARFGNGFRETEKKADTEVMMDFMVLPFEAVVRFRSRYANTIVLGGDLLDTRLKVTEYPLMTSGAEFISFVWSEDSSAVVWKVNDYASNSKVWTSLQRFLDYLIECWNRKVYWIDRDNDEIAGDYAAAMQLLLEFGHQVKREK